MKLPIDPETVKGFLDPAEGARLYELAGRSAELGPCLEVGSYCGKSTVYLGVAARASDNTVYAVDHHVGNLVIGGGGYREVGAASTWNENRTGRGNASVGSGAGGDGVVGYAAGKHRGQGTRLVHGHIERIVELQSAGHVAFPTGEGVRPRRDCG